MDAFIAKSPRTVKRGLLPTTKTVSVAPDDALCSSVYPLSAALDVAAEFHNTKFLLFEL